MPATVLNLSLVVPSSEHGRVLRLVADAAAQVTADELRAVRGVERMFERVLAELAPGDPLVRARLRGHVARRRLLQAEGGLLSAQELGEVLGLSRQAIDKRRLARQLLAFEGERRGFSYPAWQIRDARVLPGLDRVLDVLKGEDPLTVARFMLSGNARLGDARPLDVLRQGDVNAVLRAARAEGEHGAA